MKLSGPIDLIRESLRIFFEKKNLIYFLKIYSVVFVLGLISFVTAFTLSNTGYSNEQYVKTIVDGNPPLIIVLVFVWSIVSFFLGLWANVAGYESVKRVVDGGVLEFKDTYKDVLKHLIRFALVGFLVGLATIFGLILLIVPGIIFSVWYGFSVWFVVDKNQGVLQSMRQSKQLVKGRFWKVLGRMAVLVIFGIVIQTGFSFVPGIGPAIGTLFNGLMLVPIFLLYRELAAQ